MLLRQTADTFQAAATFLDLIQIWGELDEETAAKIKYAKYHALRIAKALKAGEDPNDSNPKPQAEGALPSLDANDVEVRSLGGIGSGSPAGLPPTTSSVDQGHSRLVPAVPRAAVEDVPDETELQQSAVRTTTSDSEPSSAMRHLPVVDAVNPDEVSPVDAPASVEDYYHQDAAHDVSPLGPDLAANDQRRQATTRGDYFPQADMASTESSHGGQGRQQQQQQELSLPSAPSDLSSRHPDTVPSSISLNDTQPTAAALPAPSAASIPPPNPTQPQLHREPHPQPPFQSTLAPRFSYQPPTAAADAAAVAANTTIPPSSVASATPIIAPSPHQQQQPQQQQQQPKAPRAAMLPASLPSPPPPPTISTANANANTNVPLSDENIASSQKHARWAISALNFEDVPTAIRELRAALDVLEGGGGA